MTDKIVELINKVIKNSWSHTFFKKYKNPFFSSNLNKQAKHIDPETILNVEIWKKYS